MSLQRMTAAPKATFFPAAGARKVTFKAQRGNTDDTDVTDEHGWRMWRYDDG